MRAFSVLCVSWFRVEGLARVWASCKAWHESVLLTCLGFCHTSTVGLRKCSERRFESGSMTDSAQRSLLHFSVWHDSSGLQKNIPKNPILPVLSSESTHFCVQVPFRSTLRVGLSSDARSVGE